MPIHMKRTEKLKCAMAQPGFASKLELTNGHKTKNGNWDEDATQRANAKRVRMERKMEALGKECGFTMDYGALTVRVKFADGREAGIP